MSKLCLDASPEEVGFNVIREFAVSKILVDGQRAADVNGSSAKLCPKFACAMDGDHIKGILRRRAKFAVFLRPHQHKILDSRKLPSRIHITFDINFALLFSKFQNVFGNPIRLFIRAQFQELDCRITVGNTEIIEVHSPSSRSNAEQKGKDNSTESKAASRVVKRTR